MKKLIIIMVAVVLSVIAIPAIAAETYGGKNNTFSASTYRDSQNKATLSSNSGNNGTTGTGTSSEYGGGGGRSIGLPTTSSVHSGTLASSTTGAGRTGTATTTKTSIYTDSAGKQWKSSE